MAFPRFPERRQCLPQIEPEASLRERFRLPFRAASVIYDESGAKHASRLSHPMCFRELSPVHYSERFRHFD